MIKLKDCFKDLDNMMLFKATTEAGRGTLPGCMVMNGITGRVIINPDRALCTGFYRIKFVATKKSAILCSNPQVLSYESLITFSSSSIKAMFPYQREVTFLAN